MNIAQNGNPSFRVRVPIKNSESSATIPLGAPVALVLNGTDDGIGVVLPNTSAVKAHAFAFGVACQALTTNQQGEAIVSGFVRQAIMLQKTRAASTDDWSASTLSQGVLLNVDTVNNAFSTSGGTLAKTSYLPFAVLGESTVGASSASATSDTRTAITALMKIFVRML